jgi:A/G-specific adenine glycosylase
MRKMKTSAAQHDRKRGITSALLRWYKRDRRDLPWRDEKNPYRVLVSEVMLQQTQVARVLTKYPEFLRKFPSFRKLATASAADVIRAWRGMGYNSRVLRLRTLSQIVDRTLRGKLPSDIASLQQLPGIGRYTAHAVACFAFGQQVPVVDTNVVRVLGRLYPVPGEHALPETDSVWDLAASHLPRSKAHDWNQALMDLGATICTAARPRCETCPIRSLCPSAHSVPRRTAAKAATEPGRKGVPNRIYRGKIIDVLRNLQNGDSLSISTLARTAVNGYSKLDDRWFRSLLRGLEHDGMITINKRGAVSLPDE